MRLNRLDLLRYGRFDNQELMFRRPDEGVPDVSIVYGPNEAGKSTAFTAFLELLFGMKKRDHPYAFRFGRANLLVGAELELPNQGDIVLRRSSKTKESLTDLKGNPFPEATLTSALHGMTQQTYQERFSLNDAELRDGGKKIAGAEGDLGKLLHAGLSGITGMSGALNVLSERADHFHKRSARNTTLTRAKKRLGEINKALNDSRVTATRERKLNKRVKESEENFSIADKRFSETINRKAAAQKAQVHHELTRKIQQLDEELANYPEGPTLTDETPEIVAAALQAIESETKRLSILKGDIKQCQQTIETHPKDAIADSLSTELSQLDSLTIDNAPVTSRAATARADLKYNEATLSEINAEIDAALTSLDLTSASATALVLTPEELKALRQAIESCEATASALHVAQEKFSLLEVNSDDAPTEPKDLTALQAALDAWDRHADLSRYEESLRKTSDAHTIHVSGLPGNWKELVYQGLPPQETVEKAARDWNRNAAELKAAKQTHQTQLDELAEAQSALTLLTDAPEATSLEQTEATRRQRDAAWNEHKRNFDSESASVFETAMYADDAARAHYLDGAEARQRLATVTNEVGKKQSHCATTASRVQISQTAFDQLEDHCMALALALGLQATDPASSFSSRLGALSNAALSDAELSNARTALTTAVEQQSNAKAVLLHSANEVGIVGADAEVETHVRRLLASQKSDQKRWRDWLTTKTKKAELDSDLQEAQAIHTAAQMALDAVAASLPLPDRSLRSLKSSLPVLSSLPELYKSQQHTKTLIAQSAAAIEAIGDSAQRLSALTGELQTTADMDATSVINSARERVAASARATRERMNAKERLHKLTQEVASCETAIAQANSRLTQCFSGQVDHLTSELTPKQRVALLVKRDSMRLKQRDAERARDRAHEGVDRSLFETELSRLPSDTRMAELEVEIDDAKQSRDQALNELTTARRTYDTALRAEERSDLITERATLQEELYTQAREALVAGLGVQLARSALRDLAEERRSEMLRDVESDFVSMTAPAWKRITVWSETGADKLVGVEEDGGQVAVENMSTGTMGQLYFALRLAGYRSFARDPGPLPMILDDIMETFDDTRASAALELCAQIGTVGQAILFTHHEHLLELAKNRVPGINIVQMPQVIPV